MGAEHREAVECNRYDWAEVCHVWDNQLWDLAEKLIEEPLSWTYSDFLPPLFRDAEMNAWWEKYFGIVIDPTATPPRTLLDTARPPLFDFERTPGYEEKLRFFTLDMANGVKSSLQRNAGRSLTATNGPLSVENMSDQTKASIEGMHPTTKACEADMGMMRQINVTCNNISDESNGGMVHARGMGFFKVPEGLKRPAAHIRHAKGERDMTPGAFFKDPRLGKAVTEVCRKRKRQTKEEQAEARREREEAAKLRFEQKEEEERKRVIRAAKEALEFWDIDVCMSMGTVRERLSALRFEGEKVELLKEQTKAWTKGCQFKFPMLDRISMFSSDSVSVARFKLEKQLENILKVVTAPETAAEYQRPSEAAAVFRSRTLAMPHIGKSLSWRDDLDTEDEKEAEAAQEAAGQPDEEHEELIAKYVGLKFWDCDQSHKEMMIVRIVTVKHDGQEYYQAECAKIKSDGAVHESHPVINDVAKNQGAGFFGGMEPYVFNMEWVENFDAMHDLYNQKITARAERASRSAAGQVQGNSSSNGTRRSSRNRL